MSGEIVLDEVARVVDEIAAQVINDGGIVKDRLEEPQMLSSNLEKASQLQNTEELQSNCVAEEPLKLGQNTEESQPNCVAEEPLKLEQNTEESQPNCVAEEPLKLEQPNESSKQEEPVQSPPYGLNFQSLEVPQNGEEQESPRTDSSTTPNDVSSPTSPHSCTGKPKRRSKNRVRFADEDGKVLYDQRECPPSDVPPDLDVKSIMKDAYVAPNMFGDRLGLWPMRSESTEKPIGKWAYAETTQPIDDYAAFARTIEQQLILAENVFLNNDKLICTIKVKCTKQVYRVFARLTFNNWISFDDIDCNLIPMAGLATSQIASVLYQRYVFERELPPVPTTLEPSFAAGSNMMFCFCVVYADREERWDNHFGRNYVLEVVPLEPGEELMMPPSSDVHAFSGVMPQHFRPPVGAVVTEEEKRYHKQLRAMSPDYTYYNESTEFYW